MNRLILLPLAAGLLAQCHQADPGPAKPEDQLPPATQTGAGTFGLLLNGEAWKLNGAIGSLSNYSIIYDPGYAGGNLNIRVFRFTPQKVEQYFLSVALPLISRVPMPSAMAAPAASTISQACLSLAMNTTPSQLH